MPNHHRNYARSLWRPHTSLVLASWLLAGCAAQRGPELRISLAGAPALRWGAEALPQRRLWIGHGWESMNCVLTPDQRLGCWGSADAAPLVASLAALPPQARMGCLAAELLTPACAFVDGGPAGRGSAIRALDSSPRQDLCAVEVGGGVRCWASDGRHRRISGVRDAVEVAAGDGMGCARLRDGAVKCWHGRSPARRRADVEAAVDLAVGRTEACAALRSGRVACWLEWSRASLVPDLRDVVDVEVGDQFACARLADGGVSCWDLDGERRPRPIAGAAGIIELQVGDEYACGVDREGRAWCWGDNQRFGLGDAESSPFLVRPQRVPNLPPADEVLLATHNACARTSAGELWCWGYHFGRPARVAEDAGAAAIGADALYAELAANGLQRRALSTQAWKPQLPLIADLQQLAAGDRWVYAIARGELLYFRGPRPADAPPLPFLLIIDSPRVPLSAPAVAVSASGPHGCVVLADGRALCWGDNFAGELGPDAALGAFVAIDEAVVVSKLPPVDSITMGGRHACARTPTGDLWCWGEGQLVGPPAGGPGRPRRIEGLPPVSQIGAGAAHTCASDESGALWCWGRNHRGQLGRGQASAASVAPAPVPGLAGGSALALADDTSCAVVGDGGVACWGDNSGRHASPRGPLWSDQALPVDPLRLAWSDDP